MRLVDLCPTIMVSRSLDMILQRSDQHLDRFGHDLGLFGRSSTGFGQDRWTDLDDHAHGSDQHLDRFGRVWTDLDMILPMSWTHTSPQTPRAGGVSKWVGGSFSRSCTEGLDMILDAVGIDEDGGHGW